MSNTKQKIEALDKMSTAVNALEAAFQDVNDLTENMSDSTHRVFTKNYPFKLSFDEIKLDVEHWASEIEVELECLQGQLINEVYCEHDYRVGEIINYLVIEDIDFDMEYNCPQYDITFAHGKDDNKILIQNSPLDDGRIIHCIYLNDNQIFQHVDVNRVVEQLKITLTIIR